MWRAGAPGELRQYDVIEPDEAARWPAACASAASRSTRITRTASLRGWPADDRDQPRRPPSVFHQLPILELGHAVLPRRGARARRQWQRRREWRHRACRRIPRRHSGPATPPIRSVSRAATARQTRSATRHREGTGVDGQTALWIGILASGVYHGLNPGMGWPLAVAAGLTEQRGAAVARTLALLAAGHFGSIMVVLMPFAAMTFLLEWGRAIRIGAWIGVIGVCGVPVRNAAPSTMGTRIRPGQVALWSSHRVVHGAGLMLVPMLLGLCGHGACRAGLRDGQSGCGWYRVCACSRRGSYDRAVAAGGILAWVAFQFLGLRS